MKKLLFCMLAIFFIVFGCEEAVKEVTTTISGTVTHQGVPLDNVYVFAMQGLTVSDLISLDIQLNSGTKAFESGRYIIPALSPGTYQVIAIHDVNNNFLIDYGTDRIGIWGDVETIGTVPIPMSLHDVTIVRKGDNIENVNIDLFFGLSSK